MQDQLILPPELEPHREKILSSVRPFLKILPQAAGETTWQQSKIGGNPYLPLGVDFPKNNEGKPLYFLAQINFAETPRLEDFPEKGILQFYINDGDLFGLNLEEPDLQDGFWVLFFEEVEADEARLQTDFSWLPDYEDLPVEPGISFPLNFEEKREAVPLSDHRVVDYLGSSFFAQFGERQWEVMEAYGEAVNAGGHKIGGYAFFTQHDPRYELGDMELLFQLDTDEKIHCLWGDMGVANFFIGKEDLMRRDFSKVVFNWDCY